MKSMESPLKSQFNVPQEICIRFNSKNQPDLVSIDGHPINNICRVAIEASGDNVECAYVTLKIAMSFDRINLEAEQTK